MGGPFKNGGSKIPVAKRSVAYDFGKIAQDDFFGIAK